MKYLIFILISAVIIIQKGWTLPICNMDTVKQSIPPVIFAQTTIDDSLQPTIITRFLHNKAGIFVHEVTKCYFFSLDPNFIYKSVSLVGIFFFIYFIYRILRNKKYSAIIIFFIIPAFPIFNLQPTIVAYFYKIFAIIGLMLYLKR